MKANRLFVTHALMRLMPPTRCFSLKRLILCWCGAKLGQNVRIVSSARFNLTGDLFIGDNTWIGHEVLVVGGDAGVTIGADVDIGPRVTIVTGSHELHTDSDRAAGPGYSSPISVEDGVWMGAASTVLGGVTLGHCSMVAAGAVVTKDVSPGVVVGGVPARVISPAAGHLEA